MMFFELEKAVNSVFTEQEKKALILFYDSQVTKAKKRLIKVLGEYNLSKSTLQQNNSLTTYVNYGQEVEGCIDTIVKYTGRKLDVLSWSKNEDKHNE